MWGENPVLLREKPRFGRFPWPSVHGHAWCGIGGELVSQPLLPVLVGVFSLTLCVVVTELVLGFFQRKLFCI